MGEGVRVEVRLDGCAVYVEDANGHHAEVVVSNSDPRTKNLRLIAEMEEMFEAKKTREV